MLILKNEIKEVFKTLGMPEGLTVSRGNGRGTKFVSISGQCGEPVLTITKVEVGAKLTKAEREILINDYIVPALTVNKKAILDYIKLRKDTTVADDLKALETKHKGLSNQKYWRNTDKDKGHFEYVSISDGDGRCRVYFTGSSYEVTSDRLPEEHYKPVVKNMLKVAKNILPRYWELLNAREDRADKLSHSKSFLNEKCVSKMTRDEIQLDIAEKTNVANVLISNLVHQTIETARAATEEAYKEHSVGFEIASNQLGKFISTLIMENGNLQLNCGQGIIEVPCNNPDYKKKPETAVS